MVIIRNIETTIAPSTTPAASASSLSVVRGGRLAIRDATFEIPSGAVTALIGPNGAGKSTLLDAIAGFLPAHAGSLDVPARARPGGVAYVLQGTLANEQLPITVQETVTMGRYARAGLLRRLGPEDRRAVEAAMDALAIRDLAHRPLRELSGGQRQRAFVAQGLAQQAEVLLLDEPVTALDLASRQHILEVIAAQRDAGRAVVVSTHDLADAAAADHLLLVAGRVVASGPPEVVLTEANLGAAYGGHLLRVGESTLILDDHPHH